MINVTKSYLPSFEEYSLVLKRAWDKSWLTNNGVLSQELETKISNYLNVSNLIYVNNGTTALQLAIKTLDNSKNEIITTPFSYVATTNAILWEGFKPVFCDINSNDFNIDETKIENLISEHTSAILATHVYGNPCNIEKIENIGKKYKLKIIYDGAHAYGTTYKNKPLLSYGDISICSFHATKIFHTVEGGCLTTKFDEDFKKINLFKQFGHIGENYISIGINGKNSEFHAAMGICILDKIEQIIEERMKISKLYNQKLNFDNLKKPTPLSETKYNFSYYPILFPNEKKLLSVLEKLNKKQIFPRRYFYPSLNKLSFIQSSNSCPVSEEISSKILCLPFYLMA